MGWGLGIVPCGCGKRGEGEGGNGCLELIPCEGSDMGREPVLLRYEDGGDVKPRGFPTLLHLVGDGAIEVGVELGDFFLLLKAAEDTLREDTSSLRLP